MEIGEIAERDLPVLKLLIEINDLQEGQNVLVEKVLKCHFYLMGIGASKDSPRIKKIYSEELVEGKKSLEENFTRLNSLITKTKSLCSGSDIATEKSKKEYRGILSSLGSVEKDQDLLKKEIKKLLKALEEDRDKAIELGQAVEEKVSTLKDKIDAILMQVEKFTQEASQEAALHETDAIQKSVIQSLIALLVGILISGWLIYQMKKTLSQITGQAEQIARGSLALQDISSTSSDELGQLALTFNEMSHNLKCKIDDLEKISKGNLHVNIRLSSEEDQLGLILQRMVREIQSRVNNFEEIAQGNLQSKIQLNSQEDEMGLAIQKMLSNLRGMAELATQIADGNLTETVILSGDRDELGRVFDRMLQKLRSFLSQIQEITNQISSASHQILASSNEHEKIMAQQTSAVTEVATTVSELLKGQKVMVASTHQINRNLEHTRECLEKGWGDLNETVNYLGEIRNKSGAMSDHISRLSEKVQQISKIVTTIREVTEQINLLALNAAIEAARAGDQGKGFAVVANEVRKLAERTDRFTGDIAELVEEIQSSTNTTVLSNEENQKSVALGVTSISETTKVFEMLDQRMTSLIDTVEQVILSIRQQENAFSQIDYAIKEINTGMKESLAGIQQNLSASRELNSVADSLKGQTDRFKTGNRQ